MRISEGIVEHRPLNQVQLKTEGTCSGLIQTRVTTTEIIRIRIGINSLREMLRSQQDLLEMQLNLLDLPGVQLSRHDLQGVQLNLLVHQDQLGVHSLEPQHQIEVLRERVLVSLQGLLVRVLEVGVRLEARGAQVQNRGVVDRPFNLR